MSKRKVFFSRILAAEEQSKLLDGIVRQARRPFQCVKMILKDWIFLEARRAILRDAPKKGFRRRLWLLLKSTDIDG